MEPEIQDSIRNPDGTFKEGVSGNPLGRPKGKTLKEFARDWYMKKTDEEKQAYIEWLEQKKPGFAWTMSEGNPHQTSETSVSGNLSIQFHSSLKPDADTPSPTGDSIPLEGQV